MCPTNIWKKGIFISHMDVYKLLTQNSRVVYRIERIGSYCDHNGDIIIAIEMTDEQYF